MSKRKVILTAVLLLAITAALLWWMNRPTKQSSDESQSRQPQTTPTPTIQVSRQVPDDYPQLSLKKQSREAAIKSYVENSRRDMRYDWKIPIRFYGKIIDQFDAPVVGANVELMWNDLSVKGPSERNLTSDANGRFFLEGVKGKGINVKISKDGYYDVSGKENQRSFEFASPAEQTFYEPDPTNPATFLMRKKGESQPLIVKNIELKLSGQGTTGTVDLLTGKISPSGGQLQVTVWKPTITTEQINVGKVFPYDWRIQIKIDDGGLVEHKDVFAFEAPESGYVPEYIAQLHVTNGASADVTVDKLFYFYFGKPQKYGRMHLRTDGDRSRVAIDYWLNPTPGNRNLEFDPAKTVKSP